MARARIASKVKSKIQMVVFGEAFTGKSTFCSELAYMKNPDGTPFKVLYLDPESGSIDDYLPEMEKNGVDLRNIYIVYTQSLQEVNEYIDKAKNHEPFYVLDEDGNETDDIVVDANGKQFKPDAIVVDGASILNLTTKQGLLEFSKRRAAVRADDAGIIGDKRAVKVDGASLEMKDWQTIGFRGQDLILSLTGSGLHYIVTARETDEKKQMLVNGKSESVATGRKIPEGFKEMDYNAKTVIRFFREEDDPETVKAEIRKDRTHVHKAGEILEDPNLIDWQSVIDATAKHGDFVVKNDLHSAIETEKKSYEKENNSIVEDVTDKSDEKDNKSTELDELRSKILQLKKSMNPVVDNKYKTELKKVGLNKNPKNIDDKEALEKMLKIAEDIIKAK
jgi:hypothetical protein